MPIHTLDSRIDAVTIFQNGARVTRWVDLVKSNGSFPESIRVGNLPLCLDDGSVRVRIISEESGETVAGSPTANDVSITLEICEQDDSVLPSTNEELEEARLEVRRLVFHRDECQLLRTQLMKLEPLDRPDGKEGEPPPQNALNAGLDLIGFREEQMKSVQGSILDFQERLRLALLRLKDLEEKDLRETSARQARVNELRKVAMVNLRAGEGEAPEKLLMELTYLTPGARWTPSYTLRLDSDYAKAELVMRAMVCQRSGEDWSKVKLTVSTAEPHRWEQLPVLESLRIGRRQAAPRKIGWREPPSGFEVLFEDYDRSFNPKDAPKAASDVMALAAAQSAPVKREEMCDRLADDEVPYGGVVQAQRVSEDQIDMSVSLASDDVEYGGGVELSEESDFDEVPKLSMAVSRVRSRSSKASMARRRTSSSDLMGSLALSATPAAYDDDVVEVIGALKTSDQQLEYARLCMPSASAGNRGKLGFLDDKDRYVEVTIKQKVETELNVQILIGEAINRAHGEISVLPKGHNLPQTRKGFDYAYCSENRIDLPSDGQFHSVPILEAKAQAKRNYVVVPRLNEDVFRFVTFDNPLDAALPRGPVDVLVDGKFLLAAKLKDIGPKGEVALGLGVEQAIKVARNTHYEEQTKGLMGGGRLLCHELKISVANKLQEAVAIEIRERTPITAKGEEDIVVDVVSVEPPWEAWNPKHQMGLKGAWRWILLLPAKDEQTLSVTYTIKIASKHELAGGNRREV